MKTKNQNHVVKYRDNIEEWEMMLRLRYYYDENTAAAIIREAKKLFIDGREAYSKDYVIIYNGMNYSVLIINREYGMLTADIDKVGHMKSQKIIRDYISEIVMHDGKLIDESTIDTIMNCRLIDVKEKKKKKLFNKNKSIYSIVWDLTHTLIVSQRENKALKKQVAALKHDKHGLQKTIVNINIGEL